MEGGILGILGKVGFDWQVALVNLVNFLIIFFLLKKLAFGPIKQVIEKRQQTIREGLDNARQAETDLFTAEKQKEEILMQARQEANTIVAHAQENAERLMLHKQKEAEQEKEKIITEGKRKAIKEFERMERDVRAQAADLIVQGVEKIIGEEFDAKQEKRLRDKAVALMRVE